MRGPLILLAAALVPTGLRVRGQTGSEEFRKNHAAGESYIRQGKLREAIPHLERAQKADPGHYANSWDLALAYLQNGDLASARRQIQFLLARTDSAELHNLLAEVEERSGNYLEATRQYQLAAEMQPTEKHLGDWGNQLLRHRAYDAALKVYLHAVQRHPQSPPLRVGLAVAYYSRSQYDQAVRSLCEAVDLDPSDPRPISFLGQMYDLSPELAEDVASRLGNFVRLYPDNALAHHYYALSLWKRPNADLVQVEALLKKAARLDPRNHETRFQLGRLYEELGRDQEAIAELQAAIRLKPNLDTPHYRLARIYQRLGQRELARKQLEIYERLHQARQQERDKKETALPALVLR